MLKIQTLAAGVGNLHVEGVNILLQKETRGWSAYIDGQEYVCTERTRNECALAAMVALGVEAPKSPEAPSKSRANVAETAKQAEEIPAIMGPRFGPLLVFGLELPIGVRHVTKKGNVCRKVNGKELWAYMAAHHAGMKVKRVNGKFRRTFTIEAR